MQKNIFLDVLNETKLKIEAEEAIKVETNKQKAKILKAFAKDIIAFLLYINAQKDFRFSGKPHFNKERDKGSSLLTRFYCNEKDRIKDINNDIERHQYCHIHITGFAYACNSPDVKLHIGDDLKPYVTVDKIIMTYGSAGEEPHKFYDKKEALQHLSEIFLKYRR